MVDLLRGSCRHLRSPSFQPALMILATPAIPNTDWTPGTFLIFHSKSSMTLMRSCSVHASGWDSMMIVMTSTPIEKWLVMTSVSMLYGELARSSGTPAWRSPILIWVAFQLPTTKSTAAIATITAAGFGVVTLPRTAHSLSILTARSTSAC